MGEVLEGEEEALEEPSGGKRLEQGLRELEDWGWVRVVMAEGFWENEGRGVSTTFNGCDSRRGDAKESTRTHSTKRSTFPTSSTACPPSFLRAKSAISGQTFSPKTISRLRSVSRVP